MKLRAMFTGLMAAIGLSEDQARNANTEIEKFPDVEIGEGSPAPKPGEQKSGDDALVRENSELKAMVAKQGQDLAAISKRFADQDAAMTAKAKADNDKKVADYVEAMKADGKIAAQNTAEAERWTKLLTADFDSAKATADALPKPKLAPEKPADTKQNNGAAQGNAKPNSELGKSVRSPFLQYVNDGITSQN